MHHANVVRLTASDGVVIVGDHWPGDSALAYVVAHGFTGSSRAPQVRRIAAQLAGTGAAVLALDFRGHGRSGGHSTLGDFEVRDITAAVAFLRAAGHARIALVGWSMGASVVLRYAGLGGDADAVVSISSPGHWWERGTVPMRLVHWAAETRTGRLATRLLARTRLGNGGWPQLPESPVEVVAGIAPRPLLIIHGDADRYFPLRHAQALAAAAADAVFWTEAGMGHAESATTPALLARVDAWVRQVLEVAAMRP